jgi:hypothetical protein
MSITMIKALAYVAIAAFTYVWSHLIIKVIFSKKVMNFGIDCCRKIGINELYTATVLYILEVVSELTLLGITIWMIIRVTVF